MTAMFARLSAPLAPLPRYEIILVHSLAAHFWLASVQPETVPMAAEAAAALAKN